MKNKISGIVKQQLPDHLSGDGSDTLFPLFLETYYEWLEQRNNAGGVVNFHKSNIDIDKTMDEFIDDFYKTYGEYIPKQTEYNRKDLVKKLSFLQKSKGTSTAVKLLFKLVYNVDTDVVFPKQFILKASDGVWVQRVSIRVALSTGNIQSGVTYDATIKSPNGNIQTFSVNDIQMLEQNMYDIFIIKQTKILVSVNDIIEFTDDSGSIVATGFLRPTPEKIEVILPGKRFKIGRIYKIAGSEKDTIFRVLEITSNGGIKSLEIIQFGAPYSGDVFQVVSPFDFALQSEASFSINGLGELVYTTSERTFGFKEEISIEKEISGIDPNGYFAENYIVGIPAYTSSLIANIIEDRSIPQNQNQNQNNLGIDQEEFDSSLAIISLKLGAVSTYPGKFISERGLLSENSIKIQDSFFYQEFSYVINSPIVFSKYAEFYKKTNHPAGLKLFANLFLSDSVDASEDITVRLDKVLKLNFSDVVRVPDSVAKEDTKPEIDSIDVLDGIDFKEIIKVTIDDIAADDLIEKTLSRSLSDSTNPIDDISKEFSTEEFDSIDVTDTSLLLDYTIPYESYFSDVYVAEVIPDIDTVISKYSNDDVAPDDEVNIQ